MPRALSLTGLLECLFTDACAEIAPWRWIDSVLPSRGRPAGLRRIVGRRVPGVPRERIRGFPIFALSAAWDRPSSEAQTDRWARRNAAFGRLVVRAGFGKAGGVYAYNGAALEILQAARQRGLRTILDQTSAPWRWNARLLREEVEQWPGWEDRPAELDESGRLSDREEAEWKLADRIVCGSEFAASTLKETGGPHERCTVVPYTGFEGRDGSQEPQLRGARRDGPLRALFVGTLQLRKGVQYLSEAKRLLQGEGVVIRLVGPSLLSDRVMRELRRELEVVGPVPRSELATHYAWADVVALPTLSEGSANVCYEALAAGLPVITTPNAGSVIRHGKEGILVPIRDANTLAQALRALATDTDLLARLAAGAASRRSVFGLTDYAERLRCALMAT